MSRYCFGPRVPSVPSVAWPHPRCPTEQSLATGARWGAIFAGVAISVKSGIDNDWKWWEAEKFSQRVSWPGVAPTPCG